MDITIEDWLGLEARLAALELAMIAVVATPPGVDTLDSLKELARSSEDVSARVDQRLAGSSAACRNRSCRAGRSSEAAS